MLPAIGKLLSGKYYAYVNGYNAEPVMGTLEEVEIALGTREPAPAAAPVAPVRKAPAVKTYTVTLRFQYPAWDEVDGIQYRDIQATSKAEANGIARWMADRDGHLFPGKGRYWFTAAEE